MKSWLKRSPPQVKLSFFAMGTEVSVNVVLPHQGLTRDDAVGVISQIEEKLQIFGRHWWPWSDGDLSLINASLARGEAAEIPVQMRSLFARAWAIRQATNGLYEPRIANLVQLWGFHDIAADPHSPPDAQQVADLCSAIQKAPAYDGGSHYGPARGVAWDFGGIAKGWIVDEALDQLARSGFENAVIDAGGNLAVRGARGSRSWRIGIRLPDSDPALPRLLGTISAKDESVNTHGDDQRFFFHEGRRYSHLLDPSSGMPAQGIRSLTVVHRDGFLAEAGGAALYVAGPGQWLSFARKLGLSLVLVVLEDGSIEMTAAMKKRVRLQGSFRVRQV